MVEGSASASTNLAAEPMICVHIVGRTDRAGFLLTRTITEGRVLTAEGEVLTGEIYFTLPDSITVGQVLRVRLPTLLAQEQANAALPTGISIGTVVYSTINLTNHQYEDESIQPGSRGVVRGPSRNPSKINVCFATMRSVGMTAHRDTALLYTVTAQCV